MERLHATNNFPEFTGRLCPAPCETACVVGINRDPVTIKNVEVAIIDKAWDERRVKPQPPEWLTGKTVAVIGSGPAGLAAAQQLTRAGHTVAVYERAEEPGGLMRFGIPEFKMEKAVLDRRIRQMRDEGTNFRCGVEVGKSVTGQQIKERYDAVVLAIGSTIGRDLPVPGRELNGIHQAMEFLPQANRVARGRKVDDQITAKDKHVVIIGGGDTGADCLGTAIRQRREIHHPVGDPADAARRAAGSPAVADVPDDLPGVVRARGGRRAGLLGVDLGVPWDDDSRVSLAHAVGGEVRRRQADGDPGHREDDPGRTGAAGHGLRRSRDGTPSCPSSAWRSTSAATSCAINNYATDVEGVFVCGRRGPGPVVDRLGHRRRSRLRGRGGRVPLRLDQAAPPDPADRPPDDGLRSARTRRRPLPTRRQRLRTLNSDFAPVTEGAESALRVRSGRGSRLRGPFERAEKAVAQDPWPVQITPQPADHLPAVVAQLILPYLLGEDHVLAGLTRFE